MNKKNFRRKLMTESSTSDGATLYVVLPARGPDTTIEDIYVEIENELNLIHLIRGGDPKEDAQIKIFVNKNAAMDLANVRISQAGLGGAGVWDDPAGAADGGGAVDLTQNNDQGKPDSFGNGVPNLTRNR